MNNYGIAETTVKSWEKIAKKQGGKQELEKIRKSLKDSARISNNRKHKVGLLVHIIYMEFFLGVGGGKKTQITKIKGTPLHDVIMKINEGQRKRLYEYKKAEPAEVDLPMCESIVEGYKAYKEGKIDFYSYNLKIGAV